MNEQKNSRRADVCSLKKGVTAMAVSGNPQGPTKIGFLFSPFPVCHSIPRLFLSLSPQQSLKFQRKKYLFLFIQFHVNPKGV
jgi:hypothetical protein